MKVCKLEEKVPTLCGLATETNHFGIN